MLNNIHKGVVENGVTWGQSNKKLKKNYISKIFKLYVIIMSEFQSESTLYSCLNVKELLGQNRYHI